MSDSEAYKIIGERVAKLAKMPEVQSKMVEMVYNGSTKEEAEKWSLPSRGAWIETRCSALFEPMP